MRTFANFGDSTEFALQRAILVYAGEAGGNTVTVATMHDVRVNESGQPEIQPGECVQPEAVQDLALTLLAQSGQLELLPDTLLALGIKGLIWHRPSAPERLWFKPADREKNGALAELSGERFAQPHLVFKATPHGLSVWAVRGGKKPTLKSRLYQAPYWNVDSRGTLCTGSARIPVAPGAGHIPACEEGFFASNFTHSNCHSHPLTRWKGGHNALWAALKGRRQFPDETLVPLSDGKKPLTLAHLL